MDESPSPPPTIRRAAISDAPEIARLLTALGHPTSAESVETHWDAWIAAGNFALVAAQPNGTLAGLATLGRMIVLHRPKPVGRITALVVDTRMQGQGIGRALLAAAEDALGQAGCGLVEITSNMRFAEAHRFYEHLGYERTSMRFAKVPVPRGSPTRLKIIPCPLVAPKQLSKPGYVRSMTLMSRRLPLSTALTP